MESSLGLSKQNMILTSFYNNNNNILVLTSHVEEGIVAMFIAPHPAEGPLQASHPKTH
jgi:hypothetical protein